MSERSFDHLLEQCLQEVERAGDIEAVLEEHPEHAEELRPLLELGTAVTEGYAAVPESQAHLALGRARLRREAREAREAGPMAAPEQVAARRQERRSTMRLRLVPTLVSAVLAVALSMGGVAGVALAADEAAPGDVLYGVDRLMERIQERIARDPEAATQLRLNLAEERMEEIQKLIRKQDQVRLQEALGEYGEALRLMAAGPEGSDPQGAAARVGEMNQVLVRNEERMQQYAFQEPDEDDEGNGWWVDDDFEHPVASALAERHDVEYEVIVGWFTDGYGFGEIMHALETSDKLGDVTPQDLLDKKDDLGGWGEVWQEFDLIGRPDDAGPPEDKEPGPPDDVGPPDGRGPDGEGPPGLQDKDKEPGPPSHAGPKDKDD